MESPMSSELSGKTLASAWDIANFSYYEWVGSTKFLEIPYPLWVLFQCKRSDLSCSTSAFSFFFESLSQQSLDVSTHSVIIRQDHAINYYTKLVIGYPIALPFLPVRRQSDEGKGAGLECACSLGVWPQGPLEAHGHSGIEENIRILCPTTLYTLINNWERGIYTR